MKKIYISGKITGIEKEAFELFKAKEIELINRGNIVINPMDLEHNHDRSWNNYMRECLKHLCDCDAIYMLPNYKDSRGANIELELAKVFELEIIFEAKID